MKRFSALLEQLAVQSREAARLALLAQYLRDTPDPDRGWALALLLGGAVPRLTTPALLRRLAESRIDAHLFALSHEHVGDLAETVALIWPEPEPENTWSVSLPAAVEFLAGLDRRAAPAALAQWLNHLPVAERWALLKLAAGRPAPGMSGPLARQAVAAVAGRPAFEIDELWQAVAPPYPALFSWIEGRAERPRPPAHGFRAPMRAREVRLKELMEFQPELFRAEWLWTGQRLLLAAGEQGNALYDSEGEDVSTQFSALLEAAGPNVVLDGVLPAPVDTFGPPGVRDAPVLYLHDILAEADEDLRPLSWSARRQRLEAWYARVRPAGMALSPRLAFAGWEELDRRRGAAPPGAAGIMLKSAESGYVPGPPDGQWLAWRAEPQRIEVVAMYARPEEGRNSGIYADLTVGLWRDGELVPVGRVTAGDDPALGQSLDDWVRAHVTARHGPVREVAPELVLEVAFDGFVRSRRHKAGLQLVRPGIVRLCPDRAASAAGRLDALPGFRESEA